MSYWKHIKILIKDKIFDESDDDYSIRLTVKIGLRGGFDPCPQNIKKNDC